MSSADDFGYEPASVPPGALFVDCDEPLRLFPSSAAAEQYLQSVGLEADVCPIAYGPRGEIYRVQSQLGRITIDRANEPDRPGELKNLLLHYLECCEEPEDSTEELDCLVAEAWSIERNYWLQHRAQSEAGFGRVRIGSWIGFVFVGGAILYLLFYVLR